MERTANDMERDKQKNLQHFNDLLVPLQPAMKDADSHPQEMGGLTSANKCLASARGVEVTIISARHLPKMDSMGTCDGYCKIAWQGQKHETKVKKCSYSPDWNETFTFSFDDVSQHQQNFTQEGSFPVLHEGKTVIGNDKQPCVINFKMHLLVTNEKALSVGEGVSDVEIRMFPTTVKGEYKVKTAQTADKGTQGIEELVELEEGERERNKIMKRKEAERRKGKEALPERMHPLAFASPLRSTFFEFGAHTHQNRQPSL